MQLLQPEQPAVTVRQLIDQQQQLMLFDDDHGRGAEEAVIKRKPLSRRSLRKILSRLHLDVWTAQHDAKILDLLLRHTRGGGGQTVDDLTAGDWRAIRAELNAATRSAFPVEELQRRLAEYRREFEAVSRIKDHHGFRYDARRRVVVATEAEWKRYVLVGAAAHHHPIAIDTQTIFQNSEWKRCVPIILTLLGGFRRTRRRWRTRGGARTSVASG